MLEGLFEAKELAEAVSLDCDLVVHCQEQVELLERLAQHSSHTFFRFFSSSILE
jgi:alanine racemase